MKEEVQFKTADPNLEFWSIFENTINTYGEKPAILDEHGKTVFTYNQFYNYVLTLSENLNKNGVEIDSFVSCELPVCPELFAARLAIWMSGATVLCVSNKTPQHMKEKYRKKFKVQSVIDQEFIKSINVDSSLNQKFNFYNIKHGKNAFVVFTSGSTGEPKEILHSFNSLFHIVKRYLKLIELNPNHKHGCCSNPGFIASLMHDSIPLLVGQTVQIIPETATKDITLLSDFIYKNKLNNLYVFPHLVNFLDKSKLGSLKNLFVGGSKCPNIFSEIFTITNFYGLSETGLIASYHIEEKQNAVPIGNCPTEEHIYLLDKNNNPTDSGEICFAGHFSEPYLNNNKEAKQKYIDNPFCEKDGFKHLFKTGDIAKKLPDGNLLYLNRNDFMVEINGKRVEPDQISNIVKDLDFIKDAYVKAFNKDTTPYLCCFYVSDTEISEQDINKILLESLPSYMIPSMYIKLVQIPKNPNGKVDYAALQPPSFTRSTKNKTKPQNETQRELCNLVSITLNIPNVGIDESFYHLGGSSLESMILCIKINDYFNTSLNTSDIENNPTVKDIEHLIHNKKEDVFYKYNNVVDNPKLTFVYPAGAGGGSYKDLFANIKNACNFTCFDNFNLFRTKNRIYGIDNIAKFLIEQLDFKPQFLGGWCYGGLIAYEMACQLGNIDTVFLIDAKMIPKKKVPHLESQKAKIEELFTQDPHAKRFCECGLLDSLIENYVHEVNEIYDFKPKHYNGNVVIFKAMIPDPKDKHIFETINDYYNGFANLVNNLTIVPVYAQHSQLMDYRFVETIGGYIKQHITQKKTSTRLDASLRTD